MSKYRGLPEWYGTKISPTRESLRTESQGESEALRKYAAVITRPYRGTACQQIAQLVSVAPVGGKDCITKYGVEHASTLGCAESGGVSARYTHPKSNVPHNRNRPVEARRRQASERL